MSVIGPKNFNSTSQKNSTKKSSLPTKKSSKFQAKKDCTSSRKAKLRSTPTAHQATKSTSRRSWGLSNPMKQWKCLTTFTGTLSCSPTHPSNWRRSTRTLLLLTSWRRKISWKQLWTATWTKSTTLRWRRRLIRCRTLNLGKLLW